MISIIFIASLFKLGYLNLSFSAEEFMNVFKKLPFIIDRNFALVELYGLHPSFPNFGTLARVSTR